MLTALIPACLLAILAGQTQSPPATVPPQPESTIAPAEDLSQLSTDDIIKRLPPAGSEWTWDAAAGKRKEDPFSDEMARRVTKGGLTDDQWRAALLSTGALRFRDKWPKDKDYGVSMTLPRWLGIAQIRLHPKVDGLRALAVGELFADWDGTFTLIDARDARFGRAMGVVAEGTKEISFDVEVERGKAWTDDLFGKKEKLPPPGILWKGTIKRSIELVDTFDQAVPAAKGDALDAAVKDAVGAGIREWGSENNKYPYVVIDPDCVKFPALETTGLDIKVELLKDGKVLADSWLIAMDADELLLTSSRSKAQKKFYGSANFDLPDPSDDTSGWTIRLTGDSKHVWSLWSAQQHWAGTLTIPWAEAVKHETERTGPEGRGGEASTPYYK